MKYHAMTLDAAQARIRELEQEVEELKNLLVTKRGKKTADVLSGQAEDVLALKKQRDELEKIVIELGGTLPIEEG